MKRFAIIISAFLFLSAICSQAELRRVQMKVFGMD
jgi:hypothetical protein